MKAWVLLVILGVGVVWGRETDSCCPGDGVPTSLHLSCNDATAPNPSNSTHVTVTQCNAATASTILRRYDVSQTTTLTLTCNDGVDSPFLRPFASLLVLRLCGNQNTTQVTRRWFETLTRLRSLDLSSNGVAALQDDVFGATTRLQSLNLSRNRLRNVSKSLFISLRNLKTLDLAHNKLALLQDSTFQPLVALRSLNLSRNKIPQLNQRQFHGLSVLETLDLSHNNISAIQDTLFESLTALQRLNLHENHINRVNEKTFKGLSSLKTLDLSSNTVQKLNGSVFVSLTLLDALNLSRNHINSVNQNDFKGLTMLKTLDLSCNNISVLNETVFEWLLVLLRLNLSQNNIINIGDRLLRNLSVLETLDLSSNNLTDLQESSLGTLATLKWFNLSRNHITKIGQRLFVGLTSLESLDLSNNAIGTLGDAVFQKLALLQWLDLSGNALTSLEEQSFNGLGRLRCLDVSRNRISSVAPGTFQPLGGLTELVLAENPLPGGLTVVVGAGQHLTTVGAWRASLTQVPATLTRSIRKLRLGGNLIVAIRRGDLDSYPLLRSLDLSDNCLVELEEDALGRLELLSELDLSGNNLGVVPGSLPAGLRTLRLQGNRIQSLSPGDLQGLPHLRELILRNSELSIIHHGSFTPLTALRTLDLSLNPLRTLQRNSIAGPLRLKILNLSKLQNLDAKRSQQDDEMAFPVPSPEFLEVLELGSSPVLARELLSDDAALAAFRELKNLNLEDCSLTSLRSDLLHFLPRLRQLRLAGNPWDCSGMGWLAMWMRHQEDSGDQPVCTSPPEWNNIPLVMLNDSTDNNTTARQSYFTPNIEDTLPPSQSMPNVTIKPEVSNSTTKPSLPVSPSIPKLSNFTTKHGLLLNDSTTKVVNNSSASSNSSIFTNLRNITIGSSHLASVRLNLTSNLTTSQPVHPNIKSKITLRKLISNSSMAGFVSNTSNNQSANLNNNKLLRTSTTLLNTSKEPLFNISIKLLINSSKKRFPSNSSITVLENSPQNITFTNSSSISNNTQKHVTNPTQQSQTIRQINPDNTSFNILPNKTFQSTPHLTTKSAINSPRKSNVTQSTVSNLTNADRQLQGSTKLGLVLFNNISRPDPEKQQLQSDKGHRFLSSPSNTSMISKANDSNINLTTPRSETKTTNNTQELTAEGANVKVETRDNETLRGRRTEPTNKQPSDIGRNTSTYRIIETHSALKEGNLVRSRSENTSQTGSGIIKQTQDSSKSNDDLAKKNFKPILRTMNSVNHDNATFPVPRFPWEWHANISVNVKLNATTELVNKPWQTLLTNNKPREKATNITPITNSIDRTNGKYNSHDTSLKTGKLLEADEGSNQLGDQGELILQQDEAREELDFTQPTGKHLTEQGDAPNPQSSIHQLNNLRINNPEMIRNLGRNGPKLNYPGVSGLMLDKTEVKDFKINNPEMLREGELEEDQGMDPKLNTSIQTSISLSGENLVLINGSMVDDGAAFYNRDAFSSGDIMSGSHPGMFVLVGMAVCMVGALAMALSHCAKRRRRRSAVEYSRQQDIEVRSMSSVGGELW